jgi:hypothetical protein
MENKDFVFGIENWCSVKYYGPDDHEGRYHWFANNDRIPLKNGFPVDSIIEKFTDGSGKQYSEEIFDTANEPVYYELEYEGNKRYFKNLLLSTYFFNKRSLTKYFVNMTQLIEEGRDILFLIDCGDYNKLESVNISRRVFDLIKSGKCKIILNTSYEPYSTEKFEFMKRLQDFATRYSLNKINLKVITGNLIVENDPTKDYEFIPYCYFLEHPWFIEKDAFLTEANPDQRFKDIQDTFKTKKELFLKINRTIKSFDKKVLCYNRRAHPHRRVLFYRFYKNDLIRENTYLSLNNEDQHRFISYDAEFEITKEESDSINEFYIKNPQNWVFDGKDLHINLANNFEEYHHKRTFVSVVSETASNYETVFFSEKIFKPIYACQPFLIAGNPNSLKMLKQFGFKTFGKWWDESYDEEPLFHVRLSKIEAILENLCSKSDKELQEMLVEMEDVLAYNYDLFTKVNNEYFKQVFSNITFLESDLIRDIDFEASSMCNAGCSVCPRRRDGHYTEFTQTYWTLEDTKSIIDESIVRGLSGFNVCGNFGDGMANPEMADIIEWVRTINKTCSINIRTNAGVGKKRDYERLARAKTILSFGIDGIGKSNELYRVNAKWEKLYENFTAFCNIAEPWQKEIQFILWAETTDQLLGILDLAESAECEHLYLREPYTHGEFTEVHNIKGESTHFLTTIKHPDLQLVARRWHMSEYKELRELIIRANIPTTPLKTSDLSVKPNKCALRAPYTHTDVTFTQEELAELSSYKIQTCFSKNRDNLRDLTRSSYNIYLTHNKLLMPCCMIPPQISNAMTHYVGTETNYQKETLNKMLELGFESFSLKGKTLKEVINTGILRKFVYDDLESGKALGMCKVACGKCNLI